MSHTYGSGNRLENSTVQQHSTKINTII